MKLIFQYGDGVLTLPSAMLSLLPSAGRNELAVLLSISGKSQLSDEEFSRLSEKLGLSETQLRTALHFWEKAGILQIQEGISGEVLTERSLSAKTPKEAPIPTAKASAEPTPTPAPDTPAAKAAAALLRSDEIPNYSGEGLKVLLLRDGGALKELVDQCQQIAGKMFTTVEVRKLVALNDMLGLEREYIRRLYIYCKEKGKSSVAYVEKTAHNLFHEDIDTVPKLTAYLKQRKQADALEPSLRAMLGMGERALTKTEAKALETIAALPYRGRMLELAYESMITSTQKATLSYLASILTRWEKEGITTEEAVEAARLAHREQWEAEQQKKGTAKGKKATQRKERNEAASFEADAFFEAAMKRSYQWMKEDKKEE